MKKFWLVTIMLIIGISVLGCSRQGSSTGSAAQKESANQDESAAANETKEESNMSNDKVIYFAGGCFWGTEKLFASIPGVTDVVSGYANGKEGVTPDYGTISRTGFKETVKVNYDPEKIDLDTLLYAYYEVIDPTVKNEQGNDVGSQYQTGIYYSDNDSKEKVLAATAREKKKHSRFYVEIEPLKNFYDAEEYHQDYLEKNPGGYCHISPAEMKKVLETIKVTRQSGTEKPFANEYWDNNQRGIYVDVITGEPLFTSADKYDSSCGWPSFSKTLDKEVVVERKDTSHGMNRTEVRSRAGDSHLGHVFKGDSESPSGVRYCINSASLRFVPYADMKREGYGDLKKHI